jgi:hypothetical protein
MLYKNRPSFILIQALILCGHCHTLIPQLVVNQFSGIKNGGVGL